MAPFGLSPLSELFTAIIVWNGVLRLYNAHGDVVTLLSDGVVAAAYCYDAFGNIKEQIGEVNNSILYAGYQYDEETGLYYVNARMYDPASLNLYTYCLKKFRRNEKFNYDEANKIL